MSLRTPTPTTLAAASAGKGRVLFKQPSAPNILMKRNIGMIVLAIYLIVVGLMGVAGIGLGPIVAPLLALIAGILLLIGK